MSKYSALDVAKYIVSKCTTDGMPISNLQLQKILYYIQTEFLKTSSALFYDEFEAWQFGPVVPEVYYQYCGFGAIPINMSYDIKLEQLGNRDLKIIDSIVEKKRVKNPWELVDETHKPGGAWDRTYHERGGTRHIISIEDIKKYG